MCRYHFLCATEPAKPEDAGFWANIRNKDSSPKKSGSPTASKDVENITSHEVCVCVCLPALSLSRVRTFCGRLDRVLMEVCPQHVLGVCVACIICAGHDCVWRALECDVPPGQAASARRLGAHTATRTTHTMTHTSTSLHTNAHTATRSMHLNTFINTPCTLYTQNTHHAH